MPLKYDSMFRFGPASQLFGAWKGSGAEPGPRAQMHKANNGRPHMISGQRKFRKELLCPTPLPMKFCE
jgi:hypothetical protein